MLDWGAVIQIILAIVGATFIAGGIVAYRGSERTGVRSISASAVGAGVVMWVIVLFTVPLSQTSNGPYEPIVEKVEASGQSEP